jgi:outer membrane protein insertion porin family
VSVFANKTSFNQARQISIFSGQNLNLPNAILQNLQNYSQSSAGLTTSLSYPLHSRSFKRLGITYSLDRSTLLALSTASKSLFEYIAFRGISGPNALSGIITSKIFPNFSINSLDSGLFPHKGQQMTVGAEIAGIGGTVRSVRPIIQYTHWTPVQKRRNTIGFRVQGSFISGFGGLVPPPFQRFYMGGENDIRGFDIRSVSPVAFLPSANSIILRDRSNVPQPANPNYPCVPGNATLGIPTNCWTVPIPVDQIVFPGGDLSLVTNLEYRITIAGPVAIAPFVDTGMDPIIRRSQLQIASQQYSAVISTPFGCPQLDAGYNCTGQAILNPAPSRDLEVLHSTVWRPRMSTGLELQVFMPVVNAPFRFYWAYNPVRLDDQANSPIPITRSMFPPGAAGDYTYGQAKFTYSPNFLLREPRKTFRFTVATTF